MHGTKLDASQFLLYASSKVAVEISGQGKAGLVAMRFGGEFPLQTMKEIIAVAEPEEESCRLELNNADPAGVIVYAAGSGFLDVRIDGMGSQVLGVDYYSGLIKEHIVPKKEDFWMKCVRNTFLMQYDHVIEGGPDVTDAGIKIAPQH